MVFGPGFSGNPFGRPRGKNSVAVKRAARSYSERAIHRLAEIMEGEDLRSAVVAAKAILDRAVGLPQQAITIRGEVTHHEQLAARDVLTKLLTSPAGISALQAVTQALPPRQVLDVKPDDAG